jgi:hypothetical protein
MQGRCDLQGIGRLLGLPRLPLLLYLFGGVNALPDLLVQASKMLGIAARPQVYHDPAIFKPDQELVARTQAEGLPYLLGDDHLVSATYSHYTGGHRDLLYFAL